MLNLIAVSMNKIGTEYPEIFSKSHVRDFLMIYNIGVTILSKVGPSLKPDVCMLLYLKNIIFL